MARHHKKNQGLSLLFQYWLPLLKLKMRLRKQRVLMLVLAVVLLFFFVRWWRTDDLDWELEGEEDFAHVRSPGEKHDRWILVTSIQRPTDAVKALSQVPGWKLIVVGDRKTPKNWNLPDAIYLGIRRQKALGYRIHSLLPYDSYTRKMIGYLYAIEHGAQYIYDTDDDNFPEIGPEGFVIHAAPMKALVVNTKNLTQNTYVHFGQSTLWPRGYPVENIGLPTTRDYILCTTQTPSIQQGMVNGDPDVDAMFRLSRQFDNRHEALKLEFDNAAPQIILAKGTFAPLNSQNTLFGPKALWALFLPTTVTFRATDIIRSYWAQRLLWLLGENVGFFSPTSVQKRNNHDHLMDLKDETEIYHKTGDLLRYLRMWSCNKIFFFDCVSQLSYDMVTAGFWKRRDADITDAWITDLATVGYGPPVLRMEDTCIKQEPVQIVFYPNEKPTILPHSPNLILPKDLTNHEMVHKLLTKPCAADHGHGYVHALQSAHKFDDMLLVVTVSDLKLIPALEVVHRPNFPHILYCGSKTTDVSFLKEWKVSFIGLDKEPTALKCVKAASTMNYRVKGFMHITDKIFMQGEKLVTRLQHANLMWITGELDAYKPDTLSLCKQRKIKCQPVSKQLFGDLSSTIETMNADFTLRNKLTQCMKKFSNDPSFRSETTLTWVVDTAFYVPQKLLSKLLKVAELFPSGGEHGQYDFLSVLLMECVEPTVEYLSHSEISELQQRDKYEYIFPFQYKEINGPDNVYKSHFCDYMAQR